MDNADKNPPKHKKTINFFLRACLRLYLRKTNRKSCLVLNGVLSVTTAENWKTTSLAKYSAEEWLIVNVDLSTNLL